MDNERRKALKETMKSLNKEFKEETIFFGDEIENKKIISTGIKSIDKYFGGGFKRGTHTIIWGGISNGKTTLALQAIGDAQKKGMICAYLNTEKPIDNERFDELGVNRSELIRANCAKNAEQMLTIVKKLCKDKVVDMIVVDSINALCPKAELETKKGIEKSLEDKTMAELARLLSEFCRKVNADVYNADCAMLWIGQLRIGGIGTFYTRATLSCGEAMKFYAYNIAFLRRGANTDAPVEKRKEYFIDPDGKIRFSTVSKKIGFDSVFRMDKTNSGSSVKEGVEVHFPFLGAKGFVDEIVELDNVPIIIDPEATDEQVEKIEEFFKEKGINQPLEPIVNSINLDGVSDEVVLDGIYDETIMDLKKEEKIKVCDEVIKSGKTVKGVKKTEKKRGRGRPKKEK